MGTGSRAQSGWPTGAQQHSRKATGTGAKSSSWVCVLEPSSDSNLQLAKLRTELDAERRQLLHLQTEVGLRDRTTQLLQDQLQESQKLSDKLKDQVAVLENQVQTYKAQLEDKAVASTGASSSSARHAAGHPGLHEQQIQRYQASTGFYRQTMELLEHALQDLILSTRLVNSEMRIPTHVPTALPAFKRVKEALTSQGVSELFTHDPSQVATKGPQRGPHHSPAAGSTCLLYTSPSPRD